MKSSRIKIRNKKWVATFIFVAISLSSWAQMPDSTFLSVEQRIEEVNILINQIDSAYVYGRRGVSDQEWEKSVKLIHEKVENAKNWNEYYYALRYVGLLVKDSHFSFPDVGNYNRSRIFQPTDTLFPVRIRAWTDGTPYVGRDYTGNIPSNAKVISVNGHSAQEIVQTFRSLLQGEDEVKVYRNGDPNFRGWTSFTNFLFMEGYRAPYTVEYIAQGGERIETAIVPGMTREESHQAYKKAGDKDKDDNIKNLLFGGKTITYERVGQSSAVMTINYFWGENLFELLIFKRDWRYSRKLKRTMARIYRHKIDTLIIDISNNPGGMGDNVYKTLDYLTDKSIDANRAFYITDANRAKVKTVISNTSYELLGLNKEQHEQLASYVDSVKSGNYFTTDMLFDLKFKPREELKHRYNGNLYLLTGVWTYSYAHLFAEYFKELGLGLTAGEPCGGYASISGGNNMRVTLPHANRLTFGVPYSTLRNDIHSPRFDYTPVDIPTEEFTFEEWMKGGKNDIRTKFLKLLRAGSIPDTNPTRFNNQ